MILTLVLAAVVAGSSDIDPTGGAFLSVDLDSLETAARDAYDASDWETAASAYVELLRHDTGNSTAIYNAACCFGLMGDAGMSAAYLRAAAAAGFDDAGFASEDPDFDLVRDDASFSSVLDSLMAVSSEDRAGMEFMVEVPSLVPVRVLLPADYTPGAAYPLVIGLHGYGGNAADFLGLYGRIESPGFIFAVPEAPYSISAGGEDAFSWSTWSDADTMSYAGSIELSSLLVRNTALQMQAAFAPSSTWLLGFSQGAALAFLAGFENAGIVDGVIGFGGYVEDPGPFLSAPPSSRDLRIFVAHGTSDRIVEPDEGRRAFALFDSLGCDAVMAEFEGGHGIDVATLAEAILWIQEQMLEMYGG
ncbi:MAG: hypothetical protein QUS11_07975 [Candidatus Fermentibacter sp.]|nr:hypothetical protein [Candidatus Fermentibacter sp.]